MTYKINYFIDTFTNTFFFFFCSCTSIPTEIKRVQMKWHLYYNHTDTFLDTDNPLRDKLVEFQQK